MVCFCVTENVACAGSGITSSTHIISPGYLRTLPLSPNSVVSCALGLAGSSLAHCGTHSHLLAQVGHRQV